MSDNQNEVQAADAAPAVPPAQGSKRWYVVHAYSGMEKSVQRALTERIERGGMQEQFGQILVPTEEVVEVKNGHQIGNRAPFLPGLCAGRDGNDRRNLAPREEHQKVTGFIGGKSNKPTPIPAREIDKIMQQVQEGVEKPRPKVLYEVGEQVRIKEGPFTDFNGNVEEVNYEKSKVRVSVTIFGRATPVELDFGQVEKV
jgi:transcriptional antiterminator NusG